VLVVYLVLHAGKEVTSAELCDALKIKPSTLANYVWRLRDQLGKDVLDSKRRTAKYRYVGEIECDWVDFEELVRRARFAGDDEHLELLQAALALVRGQPFGGDARYDWADDIAREM
jgi:two-component SAPR family response regulator